MQDRIIQISIARPIEKGSAEQAKQFNFSFEGSLVEFERLQKGINDVIEQILWDKTPKKIVNKEPNI